MFIGLLFEPEGKCELIVYVTLIGLQVSFGHSPRKINCHKITMAPNIKQAADSGTASSVYIR